MPISHLFNKTIQLVKSNSPEILTALSVSGVVSTAYLTGKASYKASDIIYNAEHRKPVKNRKERFKERTKLTWKLYIPAGVSGALTIGCIIGASRATGRRTAAAVTAYSLTERAFSEYREKVVEEIGKGKEQKIRDEIVQDRVIAKPPPQNVIVAGSGTVLCCELFTHRYFQSDMETLRKAQNDVCEKIIHELYVTLDYFYDLIGLPYTSQSNDMGWDSGKTMELEFSTVLAEGGVPCLAFEYSYIKPLK